MNWNHRDRNTWLKLSAAVITTDWSRWIRRNNSGCQCLSLAQCEPPSSMCSLSTQAGNFRSATPSSSLLWIGPLQHVAHSFRSCIRRASLLRLDPPSSCFISIFACQGDHDSSAESCMRIDAKLKAVLAAFRTLLKFVLEKQQRWRLQLEEF